MKKPWLKLGMFIDWDRLAAFATERRRIQALVERVSKPVKVPARRRRGDRQIPKAA